MSEVSDVFQRMKISLEEVCWFSCWLFWTKLILFIFCLLNTTSASMLFEYISYITKSNAVIFHHHHHHVAPSARIYLTLSRHPSLSSIASGRYSGLNPVSTQSCMYVRASRPVFAGPNEGVRKSRSLMSSSLLLQRCPACLVRLILVVFVMGGWWPYSCWFVGMLPPGLFQYCSQHSCVVAVKLFLQPFS